MKFIVALSALVALVAAQASQPGVLPECGLTPCLEPALAKITDCHLDPQFQSCLCGHKEFKESVAVCVIQKCKAAADVKAFKDYANLQCQGQVGFPI